MAQSQYPFFSLKTLHKILLIISFSGIIGFALGFMKWFNWNGITLVNLPVIPNILDSVFLILSASYLIWRIIKNEK
jgi:hypothetical protein